MSTTLNPKTPPVPPSQRIHTASRDLVNGIRLGELAPRDVPDALAAAGRIGRDALAKATSNAFAARERAAEARGPVDYARVSYVRQQLVARLALSAGPGLTGNANRAALLEDALAEATKSGDEDAIDAVVSLAGEHVDTLGPDGDDLRRAAAAALDRHTGPVRDADAELDRATFNARQHDHALNELRSRGVDVPRADYIIGPVLTSATGDRARPEQAGEPWSRSRTDA